MEDEAFTIDLTYDERRLLRQGLHIWNGPAECTEAMALALGFEGLDGLATGTNELADAVTNGSALTWDDWRRVLIATEVAFASDVLGAGLDWATVSGIPDGEAVTLLRAVQRKMPRWRETWQFRRGADGNVVMLDTERRRRPAAPG